MYDVVIIGAGPSGLMAGYILLKYGISSAIVEQGEEYYKRESGNPYDVSFGFGGAGLFSDGKFSYPPAASKLWSTLEPEILEKAYYEFKKLLSGLGIELAKWDSKWIVSTNEYDKKNGEKYYKHIQVEKKDRERILRELRAKFTENENLFLNTRVNCIRRLKGQYVVECDGGACFISKNVIIATGKRSSSELLRDIENIKYKKICEVGVRIECNAEYFKNKNKKSDLKIIHCIENKSDIRTFCTCWHGKVVESLYDDEHITYNGESINGSTLSNMGIVIKSSNVKSTLYLNALNVVKNLKPKKVELNKYRNGEEFLGKYLDDEIYEVLNVLLEDNAIGMVYGPEIEKYGKYPNVDINLQIAPGIYVIGDGTALFRGLIAAFVSGAFVGLKLKKDREFDNVIANLAIKTSPTEKMKTVFTAHSKTNYYAKNVICEHVFKNGMIPINPYRCFGYFLDDRIDRDIVRQANNQMVVKCDELWVYGPISDGVLFEIVNALKSNKQIRFFSVGTRLNDIYEISIDSLKFEPEVHAKHIKRSDIQDFIRRNMEINKLK